MAYTTAVLCSVLNIFKMEPRNSNFVDCVRPGVEDQRATLWWVGNKMFAVSLERNKLF
jgi:hypothetical protein